MEDICALKVRKIGNKLCLILPQEIVSRLRVKDGDVVYLTDAQDSGFRLTLPNERFVQQMAEAEVIIREDRDSLRALAKQ